MNQVDILVRQTEDAYNWTNKLLHSIPHEKWDNMPAVIESTVNWQVGHLIVSSYYNTVMVLVGHHKDVFPVVPLQQYDKLFTNADPKDSVGKVNSRELQSQFVFLQKKSISVISSLTPEDLVNPLEPTSIPHPVAKTKFEAIDWNIKHAMWHCGQLGLLKRIVDQRYDFGLRRGE